MALQQECSTRNEQQCSTTMQQECSTTNQQECSTVNERQCKTVYDTRYEFSVSNSGYARKDMILHVIPKSPPTDLRVLEEILLQTLS